MKMKKITTYMRKIFPSNIKGDLRRKLIIYLVIGILLRLIFMPFAFHGDLISHNYDSHQFSYHGVFDVYSYYSENDLCYSNSGATCYAYPPLIYFTLASSQTVLKPFMPGFEEWMESSLPYLEGASKQGNIINIVDVSRNLYVNNFFMKFPYLIIDLLIAFFLIRFFTDQKKAARAFKLWILNPFAIYVSAISGLFDAIPAFLVLLSLYYYLKQRTYVSALFIGLGISFKLYPLFFVAPFAIIASQKFFERAKLTFLSVLPYILISIPFLSQTYLNEVLFSPYAQRQFPGLINDIFIGISKLFGFNFNVFELVSPFFLVYGVFITFLFFKIKKSSFRSLYSSYLVILLLFYAVSQFDLRHFIWAMPLLILYFSQNWNKYLYWFLIVITFVFTFSTSPGLLWGLFAPVYKNFVYFPSFLDLLNTSDAIENVIYLILRAAFSLTAVFIAWKLIRNLIKKS